MSKWYTEADLQDADLIWLLDLNLGGVVYRFSSETVSISNDDETLVYDGTLSGVEFSSEMEFASADFDLPSASVTVTFKIDLAERIAQGVDFGSATAQLSLFRKGSDDDYDDRQTLITGAVNAPSYGAIGEPVQFNIEADFLRNAEMMPGPSAIIDTGDNWPDADENSEGSVYPIIFGAPGHQGYYGSPIYVIDGLSDGASSGGGTVHGLIAAHPCTAATIAVLRAKADGTSTAYTSVSVVAGLDSNNQAYSYVDLTGKFTAGGGDTYFAKFNEGGGGLINSFGLGKDSGGGTNQVQYLTGAGDVVRYLLHESGAKVDDGRTRAAAAYLNAYEIEGYLAERVDIMEFLKTEILPLLPCSLRTSSEGVYPVVWRYDATEADVNAKLTAGREIYRNSLVEYASSEVYNEISIRYRHNCRYNRLKKKITVTGDLSATTSGFVSKNSYTVASRTRYGQKSKQIETEFVTSRSTAGRIVNWMSRAYSGRHRFIKYSASHKMGWIQVGDVIALTDSDLSFTNQIVLVQSVEWGDDGLIFDFVLIPDIPRDTIPTS